jgi:lipopolysaccharide exporter
MTNKGAVPIFKNLFVVGFYSGFGIAASFARGVILARIVGVDQFGIAVILISILAALDMFADAGIDRFIVGNRFGYRPDLMRTSHAYRVFGSAVVGAAVMALAYPIALVFNQPGVWPAIVAMGGVVILRGFVNLEYKLEQRAHRFGAETRIDVARFSVDLAVLTLVALTVQNYWAVVAGAYANVVVQLLMTHVGARQKYSFSPRKRLMGLVTRFSAPIYLNAALLLAAVQGDRLVIAAAFDSRQLALYAAACAIGQGMVAVLSKVMMNVLLPIFADRQRVGGQARAVNRVGGLVIAGSVAFLIGLTIAMPPVVTLLYGPEFTGLRAIIFASAVVQMIQVEQAWLTTVLMANGLTRVFPRITVVRAAAFPIAIMLASFGFDILAIPLAFAIGATLSLILSYHAVMPLRLVRRRLAMASFARISLALALVTMLVFQWPLQMTTLF